MRTFARHAIQTHFVRPGESYIDLINTYVKPLYQPGDILSSSEKVIALCQNRVVTEAECRPGFWAKLLSRFVHQTSAGPGMGGLRPGRLLWGGHPGIRPHGRPGTGKPRRRLR